MSIEELEAALQDTFDREHLAIYADALQSRGDPRGELIAIDLHAEVHGSTAELAARRSQLIAAWLGELGASPYVRVRHGFIDVTVWCRVADASREGMDARVFAAVDHVRGVEIQGDRAVLEDALVSLAEVPRPWLTTLRLAPYSNRGEVMVSPDIAAEVIRMTPRLEQLEIHGRRVIGDFVHPNVRRLRIAGLDAIASLAGTGPALPRVVELDFAFHSGSSDDDSFGGPSAETVAALLPAARLPALRRLDLSRNEPGFSDEPNYYGGTVDVFHFVRELELGAQLAELRLPSLRTEQHLTDAQAAIDRMPALAGVEIAREYGHGHAARLQHASAKIVVPAMVAWPTLDSLHGRDGLWITPGNHDVDVRGAVRLMEHSYAELPADARAAWDEFWGFLDGLEWEDEAGKDIVLPLPASVLVRALEPANLEDHHRWTELRNGLRAAAPAPGANVKVRRYWGW